MGTSITTPCHAFLIGNGKSLETIMDFFGTQHYLLFLGSAILLNITPGQDTMYIIGRSMAQGRRAGILSVLGIGSGAVIHTIAAALGLSAVLAASASAFLLIKFAGALYLVYLGLQLLLERSHPQTSNALFQGSNAWKIYRDGLLTNLLNPKVALFFLAFLPQFVAPESSSKGIAFLFLGSSFVITGTLWCFILALVSSSLTSRLLANNAGSSLIRRITGTVFLGLGLKLAISK